jgi:hypothetical protein
MASITAEVKVSGLELVQDFFELLSENIECIQEPLKSKILDFVESEDQGWVSWPDISPEFIDSNNCIVMMDGIEQDHVTGYNRILQQVKIIDRTSRPFIKIVKAKSFYIGFDNFVSWQQ